MCDLLSIKMIEKCNSAQGNNIEKCDFMKGIYIEKYGSVFCSIVQSIFHNCFNLPTVNSNLPRGAVETAALHFSLSQSV